ncbi:hypothetical protein [Bacillus sp. AK128]
MKKFGLVLVAVMMAVVLGACANSVEQVDEKPAEVNKNTDTDVQKNTDQATETEEEDADSTKETSSESNEDNEETLSDSNEGSEETTTVETKQKIEVLVEGSAELRDATLTNSEFGYSLYVLEDYTFSQEGPKKDTVTMNTDPSFLASIEVLGKDVDYEELKESMLVSLKGKNVIEEKPEAHFLETFRNAKFYLIAQDADSTSIMYIAKEIEGQGFLFTVELPLKEAGEGAGPSLWAILSTIEPN